MPGGGKQVTNSGTNSNVSFATEEFLKKKLNQSLNTDIKLNSLTFRAVAIEVTIMEAMRIQIQVAVATTTQAVDMASTKGLCCCV